MTANIDRSAIMSRAWAIFRAHYNFPATPFKSIGRQCFAWALGEAWREYRAVPRLAGTPTATLLATIASAERDIEIAKYLPAHMSADRAINSAKTLIDECRAELARRDDGMRLAA